MEKKPYHELDTYDEMRHERIDLSIFKESDVYDMLDVAETTTAQKVMDKFARSLTLQKDARPRVYVMKNVEGKFDSNKFKLKQKLCPICLKRGKTTYIDNPLLNDKEGPFVAPCPTCDATISFFVPLPLQNLVTTINSGVVNQIAGYGSGKTTIDMYEAAKVAVEIDHSHILIGVGKANLLEQAQKELKRFFARPEVETKDKKGDFVQMSNSDNGTWTLKNGSVIRFIAASEKGGRPEGMRSWTFNHAVVVEASNDNFFRGGKTSYWEELLGRMRSGAGGVDFRDENGEEISYITPDGDYKAYSHGTLNKVVLESNPSPSSLIPEVFNKSSVLIMTEKVANKEEVIKRFMEKFDPINIPKGIVTILASSRDNPNISQEFLDLKFSGQPKAYVDRMRDASMVASENQVYPQALSYARKPLPMSEYLNADKVFHIYDPGGFDPSGIMYASFWKNYNGTGKPKVRIFKATSTKKGDHDGNDVYQIVNIFDNIETALGMTMRDYVNHKTSMSWIKSDGSKGRLIRIADHTMNEKEKTKDVQMQKHLTSADRLRKLGYNFKNSVKGQKSRDWGHTLVNTYFEAGILEWDKTQEQLEDEFIRYMLKENAKGHLVPQQINDHLMDCIRYLIVEVDAILLDIGMTPKVAATNADEMREIMEKRRVNIENEFQQIQFDEAVHNISRQQMIEDEKRKRKVKNSSHRKSRNSNPNVPPRDNNSGFNIQGFF